ncbi:MAG: hypothetical protein JSR98_06675 [Proteobacteria bacterium]|nr:hypothetical protein [Pseudomonadota bacterium]
MPDPPAFERDEQQGKFTATVRVRGEVRLSIEAASPEEAREKALVEIDRMEAEGVDYLDEVHDLDLGYVAKDPVMYLVLRDGKTMRSSRLEPGDEPRAPTEHGF